jgi:hypothetical protein
MLIPKLMASKDCFGIHFGRDYQPPELGPWEDIVNQLVAARQPCFLRANNGPRWILGDVVSRPFIHAQQTGGKFAISSIVSSNDCNVSQRALAQRLMNDEVDHCFCVQEGLLRVLPDASGSRVHPTVRHRW